MHRIIAFACLALALVVTGLFMLSSIHKRNAWSHDLAVLKGTYSQWTAAGKPQGQALTKFMEGRASGLSPETNAFIFAGKPRMVVFSMANLRSGDGTIFVTDDGETFSVEDGVTNAVQFRGR